MDKKVKLILLIDDDPDDNFFHRRTIDKAGVVENVAICTEGQDALDFLSNSGKYYAEDKPYPRPEVIFLDINMPRMDGWGFLEEYAVLEEEKKGGPVIAMLSTSLNPEDIERAKQYDIVRTYLSKPLKQEDLIFVIRKFVFNEEV